MKMKLVLTELWPFKLSHFGQHYIKGYGVCVIISSHSFQLTNFKPCRHFVNIIKMCM